MTIKNTIASTMNINTIQKAIPIKTNLQNAIINCLTQEELSDISMSKLNENVIDKLILLSRPYYKEDPTNDTLEAIALSIGTIIKEYEWGLYYLSNKGIQELQDRIKGDNTIESFYYSISEDLLNGNNYPIGEPIKFESSDHIRYANGIDVSGHNYGCNRQIEIQKNIEGGEGYTVTIYNLDVNHPLWGNNVQMAPKQMKIINVNGNIVSLKGFGFDMMGSPFSAYGIDIYFANEEIEKIILKMFDRNIELEYLE